MASGFDSEHITFVHSCDPAWFFHPHGHDVQSLQNLTLVDLKPAVVPDSYPSVGKNSKTQS